jgi:hypothetical protein
LWCGLSAATAHPPTDEIRREQLIDGRQVAPAPHRIVLAQYHGFRIHPPSSALNAHAKRYRGANR